MPLTRNVLTCSAAMHMPAEPQHVAIWTSVRSGLPPTKYAKNGKASRSSRNQGIASVAMPAIIGTMYVTRIITHV